LIEPVAIIDAPRDMRKRSEMRPCGARSRCREKSLMFEDVRGAFVREWLRFVAGVQRNLNVASA
jgi:hypothetical protein